ncbi:MAG: helix-turn-helix transcriptional regulator [Clostridia bacterium]
MKTWISDEDHLPFVGRFTQLEQIQQILKKVQTGQVQIVFVKGEAGIGKTRLIKVAVSEAVRNKWFVIHGRSQTIGEGLAFAPVIEAFRTALLHLDVMQKMRVREAFPYLNVFFPDLGGPLPVPLQNPAMEQTRMFETLRLFTLHLANEQPVIFFLDDLPKADAETLKWLQYCVQYTDRGRIMFIATCRTPQEDANNAFLQLEQNMKMLRHFHTIQLDLLSDSESMELIRTQLDGQVPDRISQSLHSQTLGIPLYILEVVHTFVQSNVLHIQNGSWVLPDEADQHVPLRITSLFEQHMDQLMMTEQHLLTLLAASDETIPCKILVKASGLDATAFTQSILVLLQKNLIREELKDKELEYGYRHPLIKAIAHSRVSQTVLRQGHRRLAAAWFDHDISRAAKHILASGNPDDEVSTAKLLYDAGKRDLTIHSYKTAAEYLKHAEQLIQHRTDPASVDLLWKIKLAFCETLAYLQQPHMALQLLDDLYHEASEAETKIHLKRLIVLIETSRSHERCLHHIEEGLKQWDGQSENDDVIYLLNERVFNDLNYGKLADAKKSLQALQAYDEKFPSARTTVLCLAREAHIALMTWNSPAIALSQADALLRETHKLREPELLYDIYCLMGYAALHQGDFSTALRYSTECTDLVRRNGMVIHEISVRIVGMSALFLRGDWEEAVQEAEAVEVIARQHGVQAVVLCTLDLKGLVHVLKGNQEKGFTLFQESEKLSRQVFPEGGPSTDPRSMHVIDAVAQLMRQEELSNPVRDPLAVYWYKTHGMQLFLKLIEGLWLLKAGLTDSMEALLDQLRAGVSEQQISYVNGIIDILSGLLALKNEDVQAAREKLARARSTFEALRTPFELAIAETAVACTLEPEQAKVAINQSVKRFRRLGAQPFVDWAESLPFSPHEKPPSAQPMLLDPLTAREEGILQKLASGLTNKEIALTFGLTEGTVKIHVFNLYSKLGVKRRTQAIARAKELQLLK